MATRLQSGPQRSRAVAWRAALGAALPGGLFVHNAAVLFGLSTEGEGLQARRIESGEVAWRVEGLGGVAAAPLVLSGVLVVGTRSGQLVAVELETQRRLWERTLPQPIARDLVGSGEDIYAIDVGGTLHALRLFSGEERWSYQNMGEHLSVPRIDGDMLWVGGFGVFQLRRSSGERVGFHSSPSRVHHAPAVTESFVLTSGWAVQALGRARLDARWTFQRAALVSSGVLVADDLLLFGMANGMVFALDLQTGALRWTFDAGARVRLTPLRAGREIIVALETGEVFALGMRTGELAWAWATEPPIERPPLLVDRTLLVASAGAVTALDLDQEVFGDWRAAATARRTAAASAPDERPGRWDAPAAELPVVDALAAQLWDNPPADSTAPLWNRLGWWLAFERPLGGLTLDQHRLTFTQPQSDPLTVELGGHLAVNLAAWLLPGGEAELAVSLRGRGWAAQIPSLTFRAVVPQRWVHRDVPLKQSTAPFLARAELLRLWGALCESQRSAGVDLARFVRPELASGRAASPR